jgi:hypothetical protein
MARSSVLSILRIAASDKQPKTRPTILLSTDSSFDTRTVLGWRNPTAAQSLSGQSPRPGRRKYRGWLLMGQTRMSGRDRWNAAVLTTKPGRGLTPE